MRIELEKIKTPLKGTIQPPPDKSISHRAAIFAAIAKGDSLIRNYLIAGDTLSTLSALKSLGVQMDELRKKKIPNVGERAEGFTIRGGGLSGLKEAFDVIDCGNSGTTARLLSGLLAGNPFFSVLTGDDSLRSRPMARVITPLSKMGADIKARGGNKFLPMAVKGGDLTGMNYEMPVASAQVKSALILAGLYAEGKTVLKEPGYSRDHTERMLAAQGAKVWAEGDTISVEPGDELAPFELIVPGDFSSAAFFIVAALLVPGSEVLIKGVGLNERRTGLLNVLHRMGADIQIENKQEVSGELVGDLVARYSGGLKGTSVRGGEIPLLIDEVPILAVAMSAASGESSIRGAEELRVKESDRIKAVSENLRTMGIETEEHKDGLTINGGRLRGGIVRSFGDHRIAMAFAVAALRAEGKTVIDEAQAVNISYPEFFEELRRIPAG